MIRPCYPPMYNLKQLPYTSVISEVTVIVDDSWKVGDLVDWWTTGCYWSGSIIQLLGDDKAKIELKPPPLGEGSSYEVLLKDLRPSLDWSLKHGWTIPIQEGDTGHRCARLIGPINQAVGGVQNMDTHNIGQETESNQGTRGTSVGLSLSAPVSSNSLAVSDSSNSIGVSDEVKGMGTMEMKTSVAEEEHNFRCPLKDRASGGNTLNSVQSDTLEAPILDLEEYVNKIKWLKAMLHNGISSSNAHRPQWEFVEPNAASENPK
ncbi:hypothetical protein CDL12_16068 [Handroanthus impetiginosus]|uniref:Agenet domain-containing protein n=1 Tax=Handroanthus impetiginosus TaxID=429701 RepID=A0A2G9H1C5_9LAMI|nr:hypothetical protein CDL12_16068 [Handroanthus impetiginosus]